MGKIFKKLKTSFFSLDFFAETIGFKINGQRSNSSKAGICLSISILVLVSSFAVKKLIMCLSYSDTRHQTSFMKNYLNTESVYSFDNYNMAFALVDPDKLEPIKDLHKFAKLEAY